MARRALVLHEGNPASRELRLGRILDFFGIPWKAVAVSKLAETEKSPSECAVFGSVKAVAAAMEVKRGANDSILRAAAFYLYSNDDRGDCERALQSLLGGGSWYLQEAPAGNVSLRVSEELVELAGPMAGLDVSARLGREDSILVGDGAGKGSRFTTITSANGAPVFVRFQRDSVPVFFCTSSAMVDINQPLSRGFYDVKDHFCSIVPLVMFLRSTFRDVVWGPQELGACLMIDDPLLRLHYGFCDFPKLRDLMRRHGFTTNIAFIPWNWRRTSPAAGDFFRNESKLFSVSIHGCDHIGREFGVTSVDVLNDKARLARSRMRNHEARTGIQHDSIMVFPQGVFSSQCPEVLKRNGFIAAVNTETRPVDYHNARTQIRDAWDIAIMTYGAFPIFTRRYPFHGLENFAFDLLLGKPCLIVTHHDFFRNDCARLIELIEKLDSLNGSLRWRPLGEVIRRACRRRVSGAGREELEMYCNELLVSNPSDQVLELRIRKRESQARLVSDVLCDGTPVAWKTDGEHLVFGEQFSPWSERRFQVLYREQPGSRKLHRSFRFELLVAGRRILSEWRDDYLSRSRLLNTAAVKLKNMLTRTVSR